MTLSTKPVFMLDCGPAAQSRAKALALKWPHLLAGVLCVISRVET